MFNNVPKAGRNGRASAPSGQRYKPFSGSRNQYDSAGILQEIRDQISTVLQENGQL
jgi:hypothetical protein